MKLEVCVRFLDGSCENVEIGAGNSIDISALRDDLCRKRGLGACQKVSLFQGTTELLEYSCIEVEVPVTAKAILRLGDIVGLTTFLPEPQRYTSQGWSGSWFPDVYFDEMSPSVRADESIKVELQAVIKVSHMPAITPILDAIIEYESLKDEWDYVDFAGHGKITERLEELDDEVYDIIDMINDSTFSAEAFAQGLDYEEAKEMISVVHAVADFDAYWYWSDGDGLHDDTHLRDYTLENLGVAFGRNLIDVTPFIGLTQTILFKWLINLMFLYYQHSLGCWCACLSDGGC